MAEFVYYNGSKTNNNQDLENMFSLGYIDKNKKTSCETVELILCKLDDSEMFVIKEAYNINTTMIFKDISELQFTIPRYIKKQNEQIINPHWDKFKNGLFVKFNNQHMFVIDNVEDTDEEKTNKQIHCYSREYNLGRKNLKAFNGTRQLYRDGMEALVYTIKYSLDGGGNFTTYNTPFTTEENKNIVIEVYDAFGTKLNSYDWKSSNKLIETYGIDITYKTVDTVNKKIEVTIKIIAETGEGILNLLEKETSWKIGFIDADVREDRSYGQNHRKYRTFSVTEQPWLDFLKNDIQKSFECVLVYDTINKIINIYHIDRFKNNGLYISRKNYLKKIKIEEKNSETVTRLYPYGKNNLNIASINPTGKLYIQNFDYFKSTEYMPQHTIDALNRYEQLVRDKTPIFYNYLQELKLLRIEKSKLENELVDLRDRILAQVEDDIDGRMQQATKNEDKPIVKVNDGSTDEELIADLKVNLSDLNKGVDLSDLNKARDIVLLQIEAKKIEINNKEIEIQNKLNQINSLKNELDENNNFTKEQLNIIDNIVYEKDWDNTNYDDPKDLIKAGKEALDKLAEPTVQRELDIVDFLNVVDFQKDWNKLKLGEIINVYYDKANIEFSVRIIKINHNIDTNSLSLVISNLEEIVDYRNYLSDIMKTANEASNSIDIFKPVWDMSAQNSDLISNIINSSLNSAKNRILSARNQNISIDERGIHLKDMFDDKEQLRIVNNCIVFTKTGFEDVSLAISPDGIVAEHLYGKIVGSNKLIITNTNENGESSFLVDENHMKAINMDLSLESKNSKNRIFLNPEIGIKLQKRNGKGYPWEDVIFLDGNDGSVWAKAFHIINTNSVLDDKGLRIDNGCIWINNEFGDDVFNVNTKGETDALGRFRVFRHDLNKNKIYLADLYKDEDRGGKLQLNDWDGNINAFLGSSPNDDYIGGFLKLYNGDVSKERIELGVHTEGDIGVVNIRNNASKKIAEFTGNDNGGTIKLNDNEEKTKVFLSSIDNTENGISQGLVELLGEDNTPKFIMKAKSSTDNMSSQVAGDRQTGGFIQLNSRDNVHKYFMLVNNEHNFGIYDEFGSAFEINHKVNGLILNNNMKSALWLKDGEVSFHLLKLDNIKVAIHSSDKLGDPNEDPSTVRWLSIPTVYKTVETFGGMSGKVINHNLNAEHYYVSVTPTDASGGHVGEVWVQKSLNSITVYNTGQAYTQFDCVIFI